MDTTIDVVIIGGGVAGCSVAYALGRRGISSCILEQQATLACGASGNHRGLAIPYLTSTNNPAYAVYRQGFEQVEKNLMEIHDKSPLLSFLKTPTIQFPSADRPKRLISSSPEFVSKEEASEIAGIPVQSDAFIYPKSFVVSPPELCARYADAANCIFDTKAVSLVNQDGCCKITTKTSSYAAKAVVIANAYEAQELLQSSWLRLEPVRGQLFTFPEAESALSSLRVPLCFDGYLLPAWQDKMLLGASYLHGSMELAPIQEHNADLIRRLASWLAVTDPIASAKCTSRVSFRTSTFDRLPYVGPLPDYASIRTMKIRWSNIQHAALPALPNLYVSLGHGSRGLMSAAIAGELLAHTIASGDAVENEVARTLAPMRYIHRLIRREELCQ